MLKQEANKLNTNWKPIILNLLDKYPNIISSIDNTKFFPNSHHIFRSFSYFNIEDTKILILGQDPYHSENQAIGLAFGINESTKTPPSLRNIINEIKKDTGKDINDLSLEFLAKQNILLLNTALTVSPHSPSSHTKLWKNFTKDIINMLDDNVICIAWGSHSYKLLKDKKNLYYSSHPSPLSYYKPLNGISFKNSNIFKILESKENIKF